MTITISAPQSATTAAIEELLRQHFAARIAGAANFGVDFARLWQTAAERALGGKLIRPRLFMDSLNALGGDTTQASALQIAAAMELLHYSFLLHDDVIDGDVQRRGKLNLIGAKTQEIPIQPQHGGGYHESRTGLPWAQSCGILMGDLLLADVHQLLARLDVTPDTRVRLLDALDSAIMASVAGELADVGLNDGVIAADLAVVLDMCSRKTASYTFELPMRSAAALAGSQPATERVLARAGQLLGLAFQLQDDLLSTFGDPALHGKDAYSDLREGKITALIAVARTTPEWNTIGPIFASANARAEQAERLKTLLQQCGAEREVRARITEQLQGLDALLEAERSVLPDPAKDVLRGFVTEIVERQS